MTLSPGQRFGVYEIMAPLGAGGMGEVFRARDTRLGREVALKILPEALAHHPDRLSRFEREARAASALNHPNIVTIHDIGSDGNTAFIAMELVAGKTLRELETPGPLPVRRILTIAAQIAEGLAKAHDAGIVHRDLKPENVMVSKDGFVKILDFGLAKVDDSRSDEMSAELTVAKAETDPGTVLGTVAYMSPEQASGGSIDYRSDQFSLGSMLYEMTTGQKAFQRRTPAETMAAVIRDEPQPVATLRPEVPVPLRWAMDRCLAKEREERYASTRDLARDLARMRDHLSETSSEAAVTSAAPRARRRLMAPLAGIGVLAAGILGGWGAARMMAPASPVAPTFKRLTFQQGELGNARFAPDGQTVVYGARPGGMPGQTLLYRTRVGSPEAETFKFPGDILAISPQDELLILQNLVDPSAADGLMARVPMSSGTPRAMLKGVSYAGADFSPDGKELALARRVDDKDVLEFPAGKVLVPDDASTPRVSHDGQSIAFWEGHFGRSFSISVIDRAGSAKRVLSDGWTRYSGVPCWTADDREIWFTAPLPGEQESLWAVDLSGRRRLVTRVPGSLELDDLSTDGRVLIAHHTITQSVRLGSTTLASERELSWLDASILADLSNDGRTLLLNEQGEGAGAGPVVYLRSADGSPAVKLGSGLGKALSPDGRWVLIEERSAPGAPPHLGLLPTGAGETRQFDPGGLTSFGFAAWLPDSTGIVFSASTTGGAPRLYLQLLQGAPRPIGPEGTRLVSAKAVSPNGQYVIGVRGERSLLIRIDGSADSHVIEGVAPVERVAQWTSDGQSLYVHRFDDSVISVSLLDLKTSRRRPLRQISTADSGFSGSLRITPDGNTWAHSGRRAQSDLYLVEGLR
jgi:eukaryotic-like serine/threonine-protein kinase